MSFVPFCQKIFFFFKRMSVFKIAFLIASQIYFYSDFQNTHNFNFIMIIRLLYKNIIYILWWYNQAKREFFNNFFIII